MSSSNGKTGTHGIDNARLVQDKCGGFTENNEQSSFYRFLDRQVNNKAIRIGVRISNHRTALHTWGKIPNIPYVYISIVFDNSPNPQTINNTTSNITIQEYVYNTSEVNDNKKRELIARAINNITNNVIKNVTPVYQDPLGTASYNVQKSVTNKQGQQPQKTQQTNPQQVRQPQAQPVQRPQQPNNTVNTQNIRRNNGLPPKHVVERLVKESIDEMFPPLSYYRG